MSLTPETLPRHELNGLRIRVVESDDEGRVGLSGVVVVETANTLRVAVDGDDRVVTVPKPGSTFEFVITDDAAGVERTPGTASELAETQPAADADRAGEGVAVVTVDGSRLLSRPARRTETNGDSPWQLD